MKMYGALYLARNNATNVEMLLQYDYATAIDKNPARAQLW
jgi:hypothetical protein